MAEGSDQNYCGQDMGHYNDGYPVSSQNYPSQPVTMFSPQPQQNVYMPQFTQGLQYPQYQGNVYPVPPPVQTAHQFDNQYYARNQHPGNLSFDNRATLPYQPSYMMYGNMGTSTPYDNSYSTMNANHPVEASNVNREYQPATRGTQSQDWHNNTFNKDNSVSRTYPASSEGTGSSSSRGNSSRNSYPRGRKESPEASIDTFLKTTSPKESSPEYPAKDNTPGKKRNVTSDTVHSNKSGVPEGVADSGARTRDQGWGIRGGRGRRGGRRGYYNGQGYNDSSNSSSHSRYDSQEMNAEERKRERDNAVLETAAFLKNISTRSAGGNSVQDTGNERRGRGVHNRYDRGGGRGGNRYQQRDYQGEDKQGKEWANRQVRTEKEKDYYDMQNTFTRQNRLQTRGQKYERNSNYDQGKWDSHSKNNRSYERSDYKDSTLQQTEEDKSSGNGFAGTRSGRGKGRGRQDRKLWDNSSGPGCNSDVNNRRRGSGIVSPDLVIREDKDQQSNRNTEADDSKKQAAQDKKSQGNNEDEETQRGRLGEQLSKGSYECMVCCDRIKQQHAIWSCVNCYNCFHLGCIKKWAKTSTGEGGWRCPACQGSTPKVPNAYLCFCGKMREPEWNRRDLAHSCGEVCGRFRKIEWCKHKCTLLCHPGPCPPCTAYIKRSCACGAESRDVKCTMTEPFLCEGVCDKLLNCKVHKCEKTCHSQSCGDCPKVIHQKCFCGKVSREVACLPETYGVTTYTCGEKCGGMLECGQHQCEADCHPGDCQPCQRAVSIITRCPCGKVPLEKLYERDGAFQRRSCSDSVPTCSQPCQRTLRCGVPGAFHQCQALCHEGPCPPCPLQTPVRCRCGAMDCDIQCSELTTKADEVMCKKQCKKLRHCGRHKCNIKCCIDVDHVCSLVCGKTLTCGLHKCEESCHRGNCPRCWQTSFEELTCHCGASVLYPPVPCGTKPPSCDNPCRRLQTCPHESTHLCHPDDSCPPCTMLVDKPCFGGHKMMRRTLCYLLAVSCGGICDKALPCGLHQCQRVCHEKPCVADDNTCPQKCLRPRETCGHPCANPCHAGPCPDNSCKEMVKISCQCGLRKTTLQCSENDREYRTLATSMLASQMHSVNNGGTVDITELFTATARADKLKRLPCNEECQTEERNRRLALALQIENPEAREKLGTSTLYSDFMKEEARKDPNLAKTVHAALTELVMKAKETKQKNCIHSFPSMNRDKRHFIHEYCEHFGCKSESYDEEPNKNVVASAVKGVCYLPPVSVLTQLQREQGQRKVPAPVWSRKSPVTENSQGMQKLEKSRTVKKDSGTTTPSASKSPPIDYFDFED